MAGMEKMDKLFNDLESLISEESDQAKREFSEYFSNCKESWMVNGMIDYYVHTNSFRVCEVLINAGVIQPHENHIFNKLQKCLQEPNSLLKKNAIGLFSQIVRKHPTWLHKVVNHSFLKELLRLLKVEKDVQILILGLHCLISLLPIIPQSIILFLNDLFEIFNHFAMMTFNPSNMKECELVHLQYGLYTLFCRLYGMFPCHFVDYIRTQYSNSPIFNQTIRPLLETVKIHPNLVTSSKSSETSNTRFKKMEPHDVVVECARWTVEVKNYSLSPTKPFEYSSLLPDLSFLPDPSAYSSSKVMDKETKFESLWSGNNTPTTTPIPVQSNFAIHQQTEHPSPPQLIEAAIEATPETTPLKMDENSQNFRSFANSNSQTARKIFGSNPSSPRPGREFRNSPLNIIKPDESSSSIDLSKNQKLIRILNDRHQHQSIEPMLISPEDQEVDTIIGPMLNNDDSRNSDETMDYEETSSMNDEDDEDDEEDATLPMCHQIYQSVDYVRRVKRLRMYSQCVYSAGTSPASNTSYMPSAKSSSRVKKYSSWPNLTPTDAVINSSRLETNNGIQISTPTDQNSARKKDNETSRRYQNKSTNHKSKIYQEIRDDLKSKPFEIVRKVSKGTSTIECWPGLNFFNLFEDTETSKDIKHNIRNEEVLSPSISLKTDPQNMNGHSSSTEQITRTSDMLDEYIRTSLKKMNSNDYKDHIELLMIQLQFEKHRREIHAERNRRLLGKSRVIRGLEQSNATITDQNNRLSLEINNLNEKAAEARRLHQIELQKLKDDIKHLSRKCNEEIETNKDLLMSRNLIQTHYEEELKMRKQLAQENESMKAEIFDLKNLLSSALEEAKHGKECRQQLIKLESDMITFNESRLKWQQRLDELDSMKARDEEAELLFEKYSQEMSDVKKKLEFFSSQNESFRSKIYDCEQQLVKKEVAIREHKSANASMKRVYDEKIKVLESKYSTLKSIMVKLDEHMFELTRNQASAFSLESEKTTDLVGCSSPLSTSLASSDGFSASLRSMSEIHRNIQPIMETFEQPQAVYPTSAAPRQHSSSHEDTS